MSECLIPEEAHAWLSDDRLERELGIRSDHIEGCEQCQNLIEALLSDNQRTDNQRTDNQRTDNQRTIDSADIAADKNWDAFAEQLVHRLQGEPQMNNALAPAQPDERLGVGEEFCQSTPKIQGKEIGRTAPAISTGRLLLLLGFVIVVLLAAFLVPRFLRGFTLARSAGTISSLEAKLPPAQPLEGYSEDERQSGGEAVGLDQTVGELGEVIGDQALPESHAFHRAVAADRPLAHYRFEETVEATQLIDSSGNAHHSVEVENVFFDRRGLVGPAAMLPGNGWVSFGRLLDPSATDFSVEVIAKPISFDSTVSRMGHHTLIQQAGGPGSNGRTIALVNADKTFGSYLGSIRTAGQTQIDVERWYHLVVTVEHLNTESAEKEDSVRPKSACTVCVYVNGEMDGSNKCMAESSTAEWLLGVSRNYDDAFWDGYVDEVAIYDRALSSDTIEKHYRAIGL